MASLHKKCPCGSERLYKECCQPFHKRILPQNALQLMRSRYAAYALSLAPYIIETTHQANPSYSQDRLAWAKEILQFTRNTQFVGLDILEFVDGEQEAYVTFVAHLKQNGTDASFQEKSRFLKLEGRWLYHSAVGN